MNMMPTLATIRKQEKKLIEFNGLNKNTLIGDNEFSACSNLSSRNFPLISPRPSRSKVSELQYGRGLIATDKIAYVDETSLYYDDTEVLTGLSLGNDKVLIDFQGRILVFPDNVYYDYVEDETGTIEGYIPFEKGEWDSNGVFQSSTTKMATFYQAILNAPDGTTTYTLTHNNTSITSGTANIYDSSQTHLKQINLTFDNVGGVMTETIAISSLPTGYEYMNITLDGVDLDIEFQIAETVYPSAGKIPEIEYATVWNSRIWATNGNELYACAFGNANDWTTLHLPDGTLDPLGAYFSDDWYTQGDYTGISTYSNHIILFKENFTFEVFGDTPSNFSIVEVSKIGCIDNRSIKEVNSTLFFLSADGVYAFTGGRPQLISYNLNESYSSGSAGGDNRRYYISLYNGSAYNLYVYDTYHGIWLKEDNLAVVYFANLDGNVYALDTDDDIWLFGAGSERVSSSFETKIFTDNTTEKKMYCKINARVDLENGAEMKVYKKIDNNDYVLFKTFTTKDFRSVRMPIPINRADHFQLKFEFAGDYVFHALEMRVGVGSDV